MMRSPLTVEEHQASPWVVRPFRLFDCCINTDGAVAVVVMSAKRARRTVDAPVLIAGMEGGSMTGVDETYGAREAWQLSASQVSARLYERAGMTADDIDLAQLYDPFTGMCLLHMEGFGLAPPGEGAAFVRGGASGLDGATPVNTHGASSPRRTPPVWATSSRRCNSCAREGSPTISATGPTRTTAADVGRCVTPGSHSSAANRATVR
jgi:acetyl-CoA acetyltransferase